MSALDKVDPTIAGVIRDEQERQGRTLELIASENHTSAAVIEAMGSVLTDKYAEGYPNKRWYCGCENADAVEQLAIDRCKELFGVEHANVQPHSGTSANIAVYLAALKPGDKIMGLNLAHGGHLSHGYEVNISGKFYSAVNYGVREDNELLDMDQIRQQALKERPQMLMVGASAYPRQIDFAAFGEIAREIDAVLVSDIAHIAGLVAAKEHPDPAPDSDFITTTTHKTLRGPRGGVVMCKQDWAKKLDSAVFPGIQGGPLVHVIAAKAVAFHEDMQPSFKQYVQKVIANAKALAAALSEKGWRLVSGGTDNHLLLVDLRSRFSEMTGKDAANWLAAANIVANKNTVPFETRSPFKASGIRFGTPGVTTRGLGAEEMKTIADWVDRILTSEGDEEVISAVRDEVGEMCRQYPVPNSIQD
ncbi:MAG: serine hydroxymethyltransferase [Phycisphaerae bacterium]